MTKRLQVILEDDLMEELKVFAARKGKSLKDVVTNAITLHMGVTTNEPIELVQEPVRMEIKPEPTPEPKKVELVFDRAIVTPPTSTWVPREYPNPLDYEPTEEETHYILRKTAKTKLIHGGAQYQYGPIHWLVLDGCKAHYDKNGDPIPYRFTDQNGKVFEPDAEELKEIQDSLGKPVKIEQ